MSCKRYKKLIVINLYGELNGEEKHDLDQHIQHCRSCFQMISKSKPYNERIKDNHDITLPDWEKSWKVIYDNTFSNKKSRNPFFLYKKWVFAGSVLLMVFILGFFAGKQILFSPIESGITSDQILSTYMPPLLQYAENVEPILIEFLNRAYFTNKTEEFIPIKKAIIKDMLAQTRLLKHIANKKNISHLQQLLEDLELILVDISNLNPKDKQSADYLSATIKEKRVHLKLKTYFSQGSTI